MLKVLVKGFLKKLKIILLCSITLISIIIISYKYFNNKSIYNKNTTSIKGIITSINVKDKYTSYVIKSKENIIVNDYNLNTNFKIGDKLVFKGSIKQINTNTNFYLFNYKKYLLSKKIHYSFSLESYVFIESGNLFYKIKNAIIYRLDKLNNSYLNTFILGDNIIDDKIYETYQINGISHLFAISGGQIILLSYTILLILNKINKVRKINYIIVILFILFYLFLTGFIPSLVRSGIIYILIYFNKIFDKKIKIIYLLYISFLLLLTYNPFYIYDIGFLYSYIVSFSLVIMSKYIEKFDNYFIKLFIISVLAFIVSFPITVNNNFSVNILSIVSNLIFVPLVTFIIFPLSLITFIFPSIINIFNISISILEYLSSIFYKYRLELIVPHMNYIVVLIYYLITILLFKNKNILFISIYIIFIIIFINKKVFDNNFILTMIDVGQGDAFLLELPHDKGNILIDTGGNIKYDISKNILVPVLKSRGIKKLDYLILTHGDYDHMGSSIELINSFKIDKVFLNSGDNNELETSLISILDKKSIDYLNVSKTKLYIDKYIIYFLNEINIYDENKDSLIIYTNIYNKKILLMGDSTTFEEQKLLDNNYIDNIDILKVGHHGSSTSSSKTFIDKIKPKYSLVSVGKNNFYGHPKDSVLDILKNSKIFRTDINGSIEIKIKNDAYSIDTCAP